MGEAILKDIADKRGVDIVVDSCGTAGYHVGDSPDERYVILSSETCCIYPLSQYHQNSSRL